MAESTGIEWNPLRGCSRVSEGCRNCYAEKVAYRFSGEGQAYAGLAVLKNGHASWTGKVEFVEKRLLDPLRWKPVLTGIRSGDGTVNLRLKDDGRAVEVTRPRPRRIFVNSMSDLFHESVPDEWIDRIFAVMALCPQHIFQVLTKRPERMRRYFAEAVGRHGSRMDATFENGFNIERSIRIRLATVPVQALAGYPKDAIHFPLPNVWLGVSVENQRAADERIPLLLQTPAAIRLISAEPLLGPLDIRQWTGEECRHEGSYNERDTNALVCRECEDAALLDWVICGGESGAGSDTRQMDQAWARGLRDQCAWMNVPFFFKQWGEWVPTTDPAIAKERGVPFESCMSFVGKKAAGRLLDGREWHEFPTVRA